MKNFFSNIPKIEKCQRRKCVGVLGLRTENRLREIGGKIERERDRKKYREGGRDRVRKRDREGKKEREIGRSIERGGRNRGKEIDREREGER